MSWNALKSPSPPPVVRAMLAAEVLLCAAALSLYVLLAAPANLREFRWYHGGFYACVVAFVVCANLLHGDRPGDSGIRRDNLGESAKLVAVATAIMAAVVVVTGLLAGGFHWRSWRRLVELSGLYLAWGIAQQYLLQSFGLRRLRQAQVPAPLAAAASAALFAMLHAPNWPLVAVTTACGVVWCAIFLRRPNILVLGPAHGCLAVLLYHAWPESWLRGLTVGRIFLLRNPFPP